MTDYSLHSSLNRYYHQFFQPPSRFNKVPGLQEIAAQDATERAWLEEESSQIDPDLSSKPGEDFRAWYQRVYERHCELVRDFFEYLAHEASLEEVALYICIEEEVDGRFDDLVAIAQIGLPDEGKMALAENYWDEMGHGKIAEMHTNLFSTSSAYMRAHLRERGLEVHDFVTANALRNSNLLMAYALKRSWCCRLLGALTILEHTAPHRFEKTVAALRRLGVPEDVIVYHEIHIDIDSGHGDDLLDRVLVPLVTANPQARAEVELGVLTRLNVALDYYRGLEEGFAMIRDRMLPRSTRRAASW